MFPRVGAIPVLIKIANLFKKPNKSKNNPKNCKNYKNRFLPGETLKNRL